MSQLARAQGESGSLVPGHVSCQRQSFRVRVSLVCSVFLIRGFSPSVSRCRTSVAARIPTLSDSTTSTSEATESCRCRGSRLIGSRSVERRYSGDEPILSNRHGVIVSEGRGYRGDIQRTRLEYRVARAQSFLLGEMRSSISITPFRLRSSSSFVSFARSSRVLD